MLNFYNLDRDNNESILKQNQGKFHLFFKFMNLSLTDKILHNNIITFIPEVTKGL